MTAAQEEALEDADVRDLARRRSHTREQRKRRRNVMQAKRRRPNQPTGEHSMPKLFIHVAGCDDTTNAEIEATPEQHEFLLSVVATVNAAAECHCQPKMRVTAEPGGRFNRYDIDDE